MVSCKKASVKKKNINKNNERKLGYIISSTISAWAKDGLPESVQVTNIDPWYIYWTHSGALGNG